MLLYIALTATRAITAGGYKFTHQVEPVCVRRSEKTVYCKPLAAILFDTAVTELICSTMLLLLTLLARMTTPLDAKGKPERVGSRRRSAQEDTFKNRCIVHL